MELLSYVILHPRGFVCAITATSIVNDFIGEPQGLTQMNNKKRGKKEYIYRTFRQLTFRNE